MSEEISSQIIEEVTGHKLNDATLKKAVIEISKERVNKKLMTIDATFWVAISFIIFIFLLFYFKIPAKVQLVLDDNIKKIKGQIDEAESLKEEAKSNLANQEKKLADL